MKPEELNAIVQEAAAKYNLDPELIHAVIRAESGGNPRARSKRGAMGLMQLMPETARQLGVKNPWDPRQNVMGGAKYLRQLLDMFDGDLDKALAAYNAGPGTVRRYGGIPPYRETRQYVQRIRSQLGLPPVEEDVMPPKKRSQQRPVLPMGQEAAQPRQSALAPGAPQPEALQPNVPAQPTPTQPTPVQTEPAQPSTPPAPTAPPTEQPVTPEVSGVTPPPPSTEPQASGQPPSGGQQQPGSIGVELDQIGGRFLALLESGTPVSTVYGGPIDHAAGIIKMYADATGQKAEDIFKTFYLAEIDRVMPYVIGQYGAGLTEDQKKAMQQVIAEYDAQVDEMRKKQQEAAARKRQLQAQLDSLRAQLGKIGNPQSAKYRELYNQYQAAASAFNQAASEEAQAGSRIINIIQLKHNLLSQHAPQLYQAIDRQAIFNNALRRAILYSQEMFKRTVSLNPYHEAAGGGLVNPLAQARLERSLIENKDTILKQLEERYRNEGAEDPEKAAEEAYQRALSLVREAGLYDSVRGYEDYKQTAQIQRELTSLLQGTSLEGKTQVFDPMGRASWFGWYMAPPERVPVELRTSTPQTQQFLPEQRGAGLEAPELARPESPRERTTTVTAESIFVNLPVGPGSTETRQYDITKADDISKIGETAALWGLISSQARSTQSSIAQQAMVHRYLGVDPNKISIEYDGAAYSMTNPEDMKRLAIDILQKEYEKAGNKDKFAEGVANAIRGGISNTIDAAGFKRKSGDESELGKLWTEYLTLLIKRLGTGQADNQWGSRVAQLEKELSQKYVQQDKQGQEHALSPDDIRQLGYAAIWQHWFVDKVRDYAPNFAFVTEGNNRLGFREYVSRLKNEIQRINAARRTISSITDADAERLGKNLISIVVGSGLLEKTKEHFGIPRKKSGQQKKTAALMPVLPREQPALG